MLVSKVVGTIVQFRGSDTADKNGEETIMVQVAAGRFPNRNVIAGTVAKNKGMEIGKTYLIQVRELGEHVIHGKDYDWQPLRELVTGKDIVDTCLALGDPEPIFIDKPIASQEYHRKSDKIVSQRTKDIQDGLYKPASISTVASNMKTAAEVKAGSTQFNYGAEETDRVVDSLPDEELESPRDAGNKNQQDEGDSRKFKHNKGQDDKS